MSRADFLPISVRGMTRKEMRKPRKDCKYIGCHVEEKQHIDIVCGGKGDATGDVFFLLTKPAPNQYALRKQSTPVRSGRVVTSV